MNKVATYPTLTKTQSRSFHAVWRVASRIADKKGGFWDGFVTVGEVVEASGYARNTVKKYLDMLCEYEKAHHATYRKNTTLYQILAYAEGYK